MKLKKRIMLVVSMAIMTLSTVLSSMQVYAANTYYVDFPEPTTGTNNGYVVLELQNVNNPNEKIVDMYFWYMYYMKTDADLTNIPTDCGMELTFSGSRITFTPTAYPTHSSGFCNLTCITSAGVFRDRLNMFDTDSSYSIDYEYTHGYKIIGASFYGNVSKTSGFGYSYSSSPHVVFNSGEYALALKQIFDTLLRMDTRDAQISSLLQTYIPRLSNIDLDLDVLLDLTADIIEELSDANSTLDSIDSTTYNTLIELKSLHTTIKNQSSADKNTTDGFKQDSDSQSNALNNLNQQSQPDKIDVNNASGVVDQNLNINTDANYGVLLSTFTSNGKILTMLLAVSSIGLISYVLFGKR